MASTLLRAAATPLRLVKYFLISETAQDNDRAEVKTEHITEESNHIKELHQSSTDVMPANFRPKLSPDIIASIQNKQTTSAMKCDSAVEVTPKISMDLVGIQQGSHAVIVKHQAELTNLVAEKLQLIQHVAYSLPSTISLATNEITYLIALGGFQIAAITGSFYSTLVKGRGKESWPLHVHFFLDIMRKQLDFRYHDYSRVKLGRSIIDMIHPMLNLTPAGCSTTPFSFHINRQYLLQYEQDSLKFATSDINHIMSNMRIKEAHKNLDDILNRHHIFKFPIPDEVDENGNLLSPTSTYALDGEWMEPEKENTEKTSKVIYYIHGGGFAVGHHIIFRNLTGRIAKCTGCRVFVLNYRLAPDTPFPGALHDVFAGYLYLTNPSHPAVVPLKNTILANPSQIYHKPINPKDIIVMGDSAGGGLSIALLTYLKDFLKNENHQPMFELPGGAFLFSPWCDLTFSSPSWHSNAPYDWLPSRTREIHTPIIPSTTTRPGIPPVSYLYILGNNHSRIVHFPRTPPPTCTIHCSTSSHVTQCQTHIDTLLARVVRVTGGEEDVSGVMTRRTVENMVRHPLISALFARCSGFPPMVIQAGSAEFLRDETVAFAYRCWEENGKPYDSGRMKHGWLRHELYKDMFHVFQSVSFLEPVLEAFNSLKLFVSRLDEDQKLLSMENKGDELLINPSWDIGRKDLFHENLHMSVE